MKSRVWTISNGLSILRIVLVVPISILLLRGGEDKVLLFSLIIVALLTDYLDGFIARKFGQVSELGKIIDPIADKIGVGAVTVILAFQGKLQLWFLCLAVGRDIAILLGSLYVRKRCGVVLQSNITGKLTVAIVSFYLALIMLNLKELIATTYIILAVASFMLVLSLVLYSRRTMKFLATAPPSPDSRLQS